MNECKFYEGLAASHWIHHQRKIIQAGIRLSNIIEKGFSCLVHCSDGWDRTAQISGIAQIILDPYYRTVRGMIAIIEKEFLQFGYQFALRTGHDNTNDNSNRSPVFHQFIECVWQLYHQQPTAFEWNDDLLIYILDSLYNCKYGTFLYDCDYDRKDISKQSPSIWTYVLRNKDDFIDPIFNPDNKSRLNCSGSEMKLRFWEKYYFRWNRELITSFTLDWTINYIKEKEETCNEYEKKIKELENEIRILKQKKT